MTGERRDMQLFDWLSRASAYAIPLTVGAAALIMLSGKRAWFEDFLEGAREGLRTAVRLCPTLCALMAAVGMLRASGATAAVSDWLAPFAEAIGLPSALLPLLLTRPLSGSAAMAGYASLLEEYGADSFVADCASVIMGSSDTAVYIITVYFSAAGVRKTRYALPLALFGMVFCIFFSCFLCRVCL